MHLFVYEYTCATSANSRSTTSSLRAEGWAMLSALVEDLSRVPGIELSTLVQLSATDLLGSLHSFPIHIKTTTDDCEAHAFREMARQADGALVIAPESDEVLFRRCQWVEDLGGRLFGPSSGAVCATGDKFLLARHWRDRGIPTPPCVALGSEFNAWPAVLKPRHGAGSQATFFLRNEGDLAICWARAKQEGWRAEAILQPFVPGQACSVSFLIGAGGAAALPAGQQHLSRDGRFRYLGGSLPLPTELAVRAESLASCAVAVIPGLRGYVGVDLILGDALDGSEDWVIEINPRMTTSYIGLRALAKNNLAEAMLCVIHGEPAPELSWYAGPISFTVGSHPLVSSVHSAL